MRTVCQSALLGGHLYDEWERGADYLTGGSSFGGVVGWATAVTNLATEWAPALCRVVPGLAEEEALRLIYRLLCWNRWQSALLRAADAWRYPLRC